MEVSKIDFFRVFSEFIELLGSRGLGGLRPE